MHKKELTLEGKNYQKSNEEKHNPDHKFKAKMTNLAPYIAEIQRRKKIREMNKKSKKNMHDSSSKSFRIKDKSATSLHKNAFNQTRDILKGITSTIVVEPEVRERKVKSVQKTHEFEFSKVIESKETQKTGSNFFQESYVRVKSRADRDKPFRKKLYETLEDNRAKSEQPGDINMYKIGYSNNVNLRIESKDAEKSVEVQIQPKKNTENVKRNNFRKNKYEVLHSSVASNQEISKNNERDAQIFQSDGRIELDKKESNVSINKEMDLLAERQMEHFYHQIRSKEINKSVEKSTEKYFKHDSYRQTKSKNDIEIFLSSIRNPSFQKISRSTVDKSDKEKVVNGVKKNDLLDYDFDFKNEENEQFNMINEIQNPSEEESSFQMNSEIDEFEEQRKKVQVDFFHKEPLQLNWSEDDCKLNDDDS